MYTYDIVYTYRVLVRAVSVRLRRSAAGRAGWISAKRMRKFTLKYRRETGFANSLPIEEPEPDQYATAHIESTNRC